MDTEDACFIQERAHPLGHFVIMHTCIKTMHTSVSLFSYVLCRVGAEGNDMWVWHDVENSEEYVVMGTSEGTSFVRVTVPTEPEVLAILPTQYEFY